MNEGTPQEPYYQPRISDEDIQRHLATTHHESLRARISKRLGRIADTVAALHHETTDQERYARRNDQQS